MLALPDAVSRPRAHDIIYAARWSEVAAIQGT
jgi:hypothetical protein